MARLLVLLMVVTLAVACSGDAVVADRPADFGSTSTTAAQSEGGLCDAAQRISDLDDDFQGELNETLAPLVTLVGEGVDPDDPRVDAAIEDVTAAVRSLASDERITQLTDAYADLESGLPEDLAADAAALRRLTLDLIDDFANLEDIEDVETIFGGENAQKLSAAGAAALRLDQWSRAECDVVIAD